MNQTGVILTGMESKNKYALPANVSRYLTMLRDAGIKPYVSLWVGRFSEAELATAKRAWNAGEGKWAGIVLDVERGLEAYAETDRVAAVNSVNGFMAQVRPLTSFLAYSSWAIPTDHPVMLYSEMNSWCDVFLPQLYFNVNNHRALRMLDNMNAAIAYESASWSEPPIPIIPVVNDWGSGVNLTELRQYIDISLARYGAISGWRLHPNMLETTKDMWASLDP